MGQQEEAPGTGDAVDGRPADDHDTDRADMDQRDEGANQEKVGSRSNFRAEDDPPGGNDPSGLSDG